MFVGRKDDPDGNEETTHARAGGAQANPGGSYAGRGQGDCRRVPRAAGLRADLLSLAQSIRRAQGRRRQAAQGSGARERHAQAAVGRGGAREGRAQGDRPGKLLSPERRGAAVHHRTTQRHRPASQTPGDPDAALRAWLRLWAKEHPRWGFRRAYHCARANGWDVTHNRLHRLGREEALGVPQRRRRKRLGASTTAGIVVADAPNRVWAVDFQFDASTDGRPVKIVSIVDEHTRECLGGLVERSVTADVLIDELDRLATHRGYPAVLRCDNGPELACAATADWAGDRLLLAFIPPGQPWRNGYIESFNSRVRDECLNINIFWSLAHARVVIGDWKYQYNHHRPHSALGYQPPARYAANCTHQ